MLHSRCTSGRLLMFFWERGKYFNGYNCQFYSHRCIEHCSTQFLEQYIIITLEESTTYQFCIVFSVQFLLPYPLQIVPLHTFMFFVFFMILLWSKLSGPELPFIYLLSQRLRHIKNFYFLSQYFLHYLTGKIWLALWKSDVTHILLGNV